MGSAILWLVLLLAVVAAGLKLYKRNATSDKSESHGGKLRVIERVRISGKSFAYLLSAQGSHFLVIESSLATSCTRISSSDEGATVPRSDER